MGLLGMAGSAILGIGQSMFNNWMSREQAEEARLQNYELGEKAAQNADARTRALYNDLYSPSALLGQYKKAGLSPSLMFGGTPGQGGMSGAQGNGASGMPTTFAPMSMVEAAQAAALFAQAKKTEEETKTEKGINAKGAALLENLAAEIRNKDAATKLTDLTSEWQAVENLYQRPFKDLEYEQIEESINYVRWQAEGAKYAAKKGRIEYAWNKEMFDEGVNPYKEQVANMIADTLLKGAQKDLTNEQVNEVKQQIQYMVDDIFIRKMHLNNETFMMDFDRNLKEAQTEYYKRVKEIMGTVTDQDVFNKWMDLGGKILQVGANVAALYFLKGAKVTPAVTTPLPYKGIDMNGNYIH